MANVTELAAKLSEAATHFEQSKLAIEKDILLEKIRQLYALVAATETKEAAPVVIPPKITPPTPVAPMVEMPPTPAPMEAAPAVAPSAKEIKQPVFDSSKTLNDNFENRQSELSDKLEQLPISDLKAAMNMNDRFMFIEELFGKNADEFNKTVDELNRLSSLDAAKEYMSTRLQTSSHFAKHPDTARVFKELVVRRFS